MTPLGPPLRFSISSPDPSPLLCPCVPGMFAPVCVRSIRLPGLVVTCTVIYYRLGLVGSAGRCQRGGYVAGEGKTNIYRWRNGMQCARCREYKGRVHGAAQLCPLEWQQPGTPPTAAPTGSGLGVGKVCGCIVLEPHHVCLQDALNHRVEQLHRRGGREGGRQLARGG